MKFDSLMNFLYRVLCVAVSAIVVIGCVVSCTSINARAWEPGQDPVYWAQQAKDFQEQLEQELVETEQAILQDINDGTLDNTSELYQQRLKALAIQKICESNPLFYGIYHGADLALQGLPSEYFDNPSEIDISTGGGSGLYRLTSGGDIYTAYVFPCKANQVMCSSEHFSLVIDFNDDTMNTNTIPYYDTSRAGFQYKGNTIYHQVRYTDSMGYLSNFGQSYNVFSNNIYAVSFSDRFVPVISRGTRADSVYLGLGVYTELPPAEIDSNKPYEYYNNVVLPYIRDNFPDIPESDIVFPFGYQVIEPTEPPTTPNGGIYIDKQVNIGINIFTPTDASGLPITDASGETVTETQYVTATYPPDGEYRFQIPTIEPLNLYDATVPNPDLSPFTDGFSFIWNATYHFFNDTEFMPVVMACLSLSVIGYIIWKVGG